MEQLLSFLALAGMGFAAFWGLKWMGRAGRQQAQTRNQLSPSDLRLLEETAARLTAEIRAAADECVARVEAACRRAEGCLGEPATVSSECVAAGSVFSMLDDERSSAQIAQQVGMPTGEVDLLRGLRSMGALNQQ